MDSTKEESIRDIPQTRIINKTSDYPPIVDCRDKLKVIIGGTVGSNQGEFRCVSGVAVDNITDNIYITDKENNSVQVFNKEGIYLFMFGNIYGIGFMESPVCIAISKEKVFVAHKGNDYLWVFDLNGHFITRIGSKWRGRRGRRGTREHLYFPGITICGTSGDIYLCDYSHNRIRILSQDNPNLLQLGDGLLYSPRSIQLTKDIIYVLSYLNPYLYTFDYNLMQVKNTVSIPIGKHLNTPLSFILDGAGNFIISDYNKNSVFIFDQHGQLFHKILVTQGISLPVGVALDSEGRIVVIGRNNRFVIF